jgi:cation diffusion facilitator CzcD-associated flavoprotein CzcO
MHNTHTDIIIIGAGLSGIGAACHLSRKNPSKNYVIQKQELGWYVEFVSISWNSIRFGYVHLGYSFKTGRPKSFADGLLF